MLASKSFSCYNAGDIFVKLVRSPASRHRRFFSSSDASSRNQKTRAESDKKPAPGWWQGMDTSMHKNSVHLVGRLSGFVPKKILRKSSLKGENLFGILFQLATSTWISIPGGAKFVSDELHWLSTPLDPDEANTDKLMQQLSGKPLVDVHGSLRYLIRQGSLTTHIETEDLNSIESSSLQVNSAELIGLVEDCRLVNARDWSRILRLRMWTVTPNSLRTDSGGSVRQLESWNRHTVNIFANKEANRTENAITDLSKTIAKGTTVFVRGTVTYRLLADRSIFAQISADDVRIWTPGS